MSTRPLECGSCGKDHPSSRSCPAPRPRNHLLDAAQLAAKELQRLRDVHLPRYDGCIGEPDLQILTLLKAAIKSTKRNQA